MLEMSKSILKSPSKSSISDRGEIVKFLRSFQIIDFEEYFKSFVFELNLYAPGEKL